MTRALSLRAWRIAAAGAVATALCLLFLQTTGSASDRGGDARDSAVGSGKNQFIAVLGDAELAVSARSDPVGGNPRGEVRASGDPDGTGPAEPFQLGGPVTCLRVNGNRAAIKYRFNRAEGSAEPFKGGGVQIFIEDNGEPVGGAAVDATTFDEPQSRELFRLGARQCDDPNTRLYDQIESGDFRVHDAVG
jgi:hypothetical protein